MENNIPTTSSTTTFPTVVLKNGLRVANFSSEHAFVFTDGSILPACAEERSKLLVMNPVEVERPSPCGRWIDVDIEFTMSPPCQGELLRMEEDPEVDIIVVPRIVKDALNATKLGLKKVRTIRLADRVAKVNYADRFCV